MIGGWKSDAPRGGGGGWHKASVSDCLPLPFGEGGWGSGHDTAIDGPLRGDRNGQKQTATPKGGGEVGGGFNGQG